MKKIKEVPRYPLDLYSELSNDHLPSNMLNGLVNKPKHISKRNKCVVLVSENPPPSKKSKKKILNENPIPTEKKNINSPTNHTQQLEIKSNLEYRR